MAHRNEDLVERVLPHLDEVTWRHWTMRWR